MVQVSTSLALIACILPTTGAFTTPCHNNLLSTRSIRPSPYQSAQVLFSTTPNNDDEPLGEKFGGYTAKQRLREEVESPFRKVRLALFSFTTASAALALYFSATSALKANMGGFADAIPLEDALQTCAINAAGVLVCGSLALREVKVGNANLARIAKGGLLARLVVDPAVEGSERRALKEYRRDSRVVIAAGGANYINKLSMSLCSDQLADENILPGKLQGIDVVIVPVLLGSNNQVGDTRAAWRNAEPGENDRNFESTRADEVVAFPEAVSMWNEYLKSDVETAQGQGFDVLEKGITITVKKNGRILRRATGLPPFGDFIGAMEVADGSQFGMPGDSEKYGGP